MFPFESTADPAHVPAAPTTRSDGQPTMVHRSPAADGGGAQPPARQTEPASHAAELVQGGNTHAPLTQTQSTPPSHRPAQSATAAQTATPESVSPVAATSRFLQPPDDPIPSTPIRIHADIALTR
jgi:hypothetical protein